ncbi:putative ubiquitin carboxyl-terminal hydrolase 7 [Clarias magur]|uniref:Putative ubiquitin carboxyl-terminal hydrolase 7 n=1 Tax=Clarias magur TaxID=1594786 RepID=A0A8J4TC43_CLAMG|nr:putative ubiquitin carboxyl-terminal hydrolase 7 [Clarias magur]
MLMLEPFVFGAFRITQIRVRCEVFHHRTHFCTGSAHCTFLTAGTRRCCYRK